jgi:hypothetical protein
MPDTTAITPTPMVPFDLYKDIHKAIRVNLFDVVAEAGRLDPGDRGARIAHAGRVVDLVEFLVAHADHEDTHIDAAVAQVLPDEAAALQAEHVALEATMDELKALAQLVFDDAVDPRAAVHDLYLDLALFTARYLAHQDREERVVMPALFEALGIEALLGIHGAILGSIDQEAMAWSLRKMLPAMNLDDRHEMLAGMRASAPREAFEGTVALAADVIPEHDLTALLDRLDADLVDA